MKKILSTMLCFAIAVSMMACATVEENPVVPTPTTAPEATSIPQPTKEVEPTDVPATTPTAEPTATSTPVPTSTPTPTSTPVPTATPTSTPTPVPTNTPTPTVAVTSTPTPVPTLISSYVEEDADGSIITTKVYSDGSRCVTITDPQGGIYEQNTDAEGNVTYGWVVTPIPTSTPTPTKIPVTTTDIPNEFTGTVSGFSIDVEGITTTDELEKRIGGHLDVLIKFLYSRFEALSEEIDTYEKYCDNVTKVSEFYETVIDETNQISIMLLDYSAVYARMILDSDMPDDENYKAIDGIYDYLYEDACAVILDEIYNRLLTEMSNYFYGGILMGAPIGIDYSEWYDICNNEFNQWYDAGTKVFNIYYDASANIFSLYYDLSGELYNGDMEGANKTLAQFIEKVEKMK